MWNDAQKQEEPGGQPADAWLALGLAGPDDELPADVGELLPPPADGPARGADRLRELLPALVAHLRAGVPTPSATRALGCQASYRWWRERAAEGLEPYCSALACMDHARYLAELELLQAVRRAALGTRRKTITVEEEGPHGLRRSVKHIDVEPDWRAAAWALEHTRQDTYGLAAGEELEAAQVDPPAIIIEGRAADALAERLRLGPGGEQLAELEADGHQLEHQQDGQADGQRPARGEGQQ